MSSLVITLPISPSKLLQESSTLNAKATLDLKINESLPPSKDATLTLTLEYSSIELLKEIYDGLKDTDFVMELKQSP